MEMYAIRTNEVFGRYLVASKDIKAGELILQENPTLVGAQIDANHICLRCCKKLSANLQICKQCGVATLCSNDCKGSKHGDSECRTLKTTGLNAADVINDPQIMMPLRCLAIRNYDRDLWAEFVKLEPHVEARKGTAIWKTHEIRVENVMKKLGLVNEDDIKDLLVQKICGILDVNTFEIRPPKSLSMMVNNKDCLRGLYLKASLMAHDCIGNTHLSIDDDSNMFVRASVQILEGETIFFNYSSCLKGTYDRRLHLKTGKYFDCMCKRCADPTELNTHMSSLKCSKCKKGLVIPKDPLNSEFSNNWSCQSCETKFNGQMVLSTLNIAQEKILHLDPTNLKESENLLKMLLTSLSENHHLILELKQIIIPTYETNAFSDWSLKRKITVCEEVMKVLRIVEPGISRLQGIALYQLHATKVNLANKQYQEKKISIGNYVEMLQDAEGNMVAAMKHLVYEPKCSPEGRLLLNAFTDLKILRNTIAQLRQSFHKLSKEDDLFTNLKTKNKK